MKSNSHSGEETFTRAEQALVQYHEAARENLTMAILSETIKSQAHAIRTLKGKNGNQIHTIERLEKTTRDTEQKAITLAQIATSQLIDHAKKKHKLNETITKREKVIGLQKKYIKCLPYAFGAGIAGCIHPLLSWLNKKMGKQVNKNTKTIQEDVQKLQFLSLSAATCGGEVHKHFNGPTSINLSRSIIYSCRIFSNVILQTINAHALHNYSNKFTGSHSNSRLFIEWGLWRIEKYFVHRYILS